MKDALNVEECKELLNVSEYKIKKLLQSGELEPVYVKKTSGRGRKDRLISVPSLARYVQNNA